MEDSSGFLFALIVTLIISLVIMYYIIKGAVEAGTKELTTSNMMLVKLKQIELMRNGFEKDEITTLVNRLHKSEQLELFREKKWISETEYEKQKADLELEEKE